MMMVVSWKLNVLVKVAGWCYELHLTCLPLNMKQHVTTTLTRDTLNVSPCTDIINHPLTTLIHHHTPPLTTITSFLSNHLPQPPLSPPPLPHEPAEVEASILASFKHHHQEHKRPLKLSDLALVENEVTDLYNSTSFHHLTHNTFLGFVLKRPKLKKVSCVMIG